MLSKKAQKNASLALIAIVAVVASVAIVGMMNDSESSDASTSQALGSDAGATGASVIGKAPIACEVKNSAGPRLRPLLTSSLSGSSRLLTDLSKCGFTESDVENWGTTIDGCGGNHLIVPCR